MKIITQKISLVLLSVLVSGLAYGNVRSLRTKRPQTQHSSSTSAATAPSGILSRGLVLTAAQARAELVKMGAIKTNANISALVLSGKASPLEGTVLKEAVARGVITAAKANKVFSELQTADSEVVRKLVVISDVANRKLREANVGSMSVAPPALIQSIEAAIQTEVAFQKGLQSNSAQANTAADKAVLACGLNPKLAN